MFTLRGRVGNFDAAGPPTRDGAFALWNPADLGYLAAYAGAALASGIITGKEGDMFKAGKLGEYTVGKDATVLLGEP